MSVTEAAAPLATRRRVPIPVRVAQFLLLVPLGAFQLVATIVFSIIMPLAGKDYIVAAWAPLMSLACIATALRLGRGGRTLRTALILLAAQAAFSVVKLTVYAESASLVFLAFVALCTGMLALPQSRRFFRA